MQDSRNTPDFGTCRFCGAPIRTKTHEVFGTRFSRPVPCGCVGSRAEAARRDAAEREQEARREAERFRERCERAGIPPLYLRDGLEESDRSCGERSFVFGPNGTGKTYAAAAMAVRALRRGRRVVFASMRQVSADVNDAMRRGEPAAPALWPYKRAEVLVLDDLGKETPTPASLRLLFDLVDWRYVQKRPLCATSNLSLPELAARWARVDESTARAVASRLSEMTERLEMRGADRRLEGRDGRR